MRFPTLSQRMIVGGLLGMAIFLVTFVPIYSFILNSFYHYGAPYMDAGLYANLIWRNDWQLPTPLPRGRGEYSFLHEHFSPLLMASNAISYLVPLPPAEYYAVFCSLIYALTALAMFYALSEFTQTRSGFKFIGLALLAIGFGYNGITMQGLWMPHFEYVIPLLIFLFLFHYARGDKKRAGVFFILALLPREDAGLHLVAVLGLLMVYKLWRARSLEQIKPELLFIAIAVCYCAIAISIASSHSVMNGIYTGKPFYAHLSVDLIKERLAFIISERPYVYLIILGGALWSCLKKDILMFIGFAAYVPWLLFNLTAYNNNTGKFYAYYLFPLVLSLGWPLLAYSFRYGKDIPPAAKRECLMFQSVIIILGLIAWNVSESYYSTIGMGARWGSYIPLTTAEERGKVREFIRRIETPPKTMGKVMLSFPVSCLTNAFYPDGPVVSYSHEGRADTLVYFTSELNNPDTGKPIVKNHMRYAFNVDGTQLKVQSNRDLSLEPELESILVKLN